MLEATMSLELARLVEAHGGVAVCVPALVKCPDTDRSRAERLIEALTNRSFDAAIFMTGAAVSLLFQMAEPMGRRPDLLAGLRGMTTVCRGPKPTAALRGYGVPTTLAARHPYTSAELIDALGAINVREARFVLFHCGERSDALAETLLACRAVLHEEWLYRWQAPADTSALERLVADIVGGEIDALVVTCQVQFRHLLQVATTCGRARQLVDALNARIVVAAVGPRCHAVLRSHGVDVHVMPDCPKAGPLVTSLMRALDRGKAGVSCRAETRREER
jgi:uroporphyrinogen-III synthase